MKDKVERIRAALKAVDTGKEAVESVARELNIDKRQRLEELLKLVRAGKMGDEELDKLAHRIIELSSSPDVDTALLNFYKFVQASTRQFMSTSFCLEKPVFEILLKIFSASNYFSNILTSNPGLILWLLEEKTLFQSRSYSSYIKGIRAQIAPFRDIRRIINGIKSFRARETLRIATRDLMGISAIDEVTAELSYLADAVIHMVSELSFREVCAEMSLGDVEWILDRWAPYSNFAVISLGKLGGHELNYSSDIDLLYITGEPKDDSEAGFYVELARRITENLSAMTEKGTLYRVDLRLRPDGESGPIVVSISGHLYYMMHRAHYWERQALLKARGSAGNAAVIDSFLENCRKLIFDPFDAASALSNIAAMRERAVSSLNPMERNRNIKEMPGGIRDIEFIVQALQMIHGRSRPEVLSRNTLESIERLRNAGLLKEETAVVLERAYILYRTIEHRLQMVNNRRIHTIPTEEEELKKLTGRVAMSALGDLTAEKFASELASNIKLVENIFNHLFRNQSPDIIYFLSLNPSRALNLFGRISPEYTEEVVERILPFIRSLVFGDFPDLASVQVRQSARKALPVLLKDMAETPDPSLTMKNIHMIIKSTGAVKSMLDSVAADAEMRRLLIKLSSTSSVVSKILAENIEWLDTVIEGYEFEIHRASSIGELRKSFMQNLVLAILNNPIPEKDPDEIGLSLSNLVERTISQLFWIIGGESTSLALLSAGSLGTRECRFGSDIDIIALTPAEVPEERDFEMVKNLLRAADEVGLKKIDLRLRPEGSGSPTVNTMDRYRKYLNNRASPWEIVSYTRTRFICGNVAAAEEFKTMLDDLASGLDINDEFVSRLLEVRAKMESISRNEWSIKHAPGGTYDIEFITSLLFLLQRRKGTREESTTRTLASFLGSPEFLKKHGLSAADIETLIGNYRLYYLTAHGASLQDFPLPPVEYRREYYSRYFSRLFKTLPGVGTTFDEHLRGIQKQTRGIFDRVFRRTRL